ncbi:MAG: sigma-70 family RNA polymerase sigma factor, partial [Lentisphaeria bacterium]|nr:sigma-70 family RNA polymerase sigma factor [Lentisphaeria bacterium]
FIEDRPVSEVAAITGKTANTLYSIKHRCLKKLQTIIIQLQNQLETPPDTGKPSAPNTTSR